MRSPGPRTASPDETTTDADDTVSAGTTSNKTP